MDAPRTAAPGAELAGRLLAWYGAQARPLPWRRTRDPYAVLVSEVMLQQTQVARVVPAWEAFLRRFPDVHALAAAARADVLTAWRGLGYNRRAVGLHRAARAIVDDHAGRVPADLEALQALPGVGAYTARAVLAFAHGRDEAPVDTNVARVLRRAVAGAPLAAAPLQRLADAAVPPGAGRDWSQALMDLGAQVCAARAPRCGDCPIAPSCAWRRGGGDDPAGSGRRGKQQAFAGSDRFHRGRIVDALRSGPVPRAALARAAACDDRARVDRLVADLLGDGLAEWHGEQLRLPAAGEV